MLCQLLEIFLLRVHFRLTGKGTVLIAIALLHFPTGLNRICRWVFASLKGRPKSTTDIGNSGPHKEETGGPRRQPKAYHTLGLPSHTEAFPSTMRGGGIMLKSGRGICFSYVAQTRLPSCWIEGNILFQQETCKLWKRFIFMLHLI